MCPGGACPQGKLVDPLDEDHVSAERVSRRDLNFAAILLLVQTRKFTTRTNGA